MLGSALEHYRRQQRLTAAGVTEARRVSDDEEAVIRTIATYQLASITLTLRSTPLELQEQQIDAEPVANVRAAALLTAPAATTTMLSKVANKEALDRLVATLILDASRTAASVDVARRPRLTGYVRSLNPPSCSRCAVLAGRVYRYSTGFRRHPNCDCLMTPTTQAVGRDLVTDPTDLAKSGLVRGLSKADLEAVDMGADLNQVVNVRRTQAGLTVGSSVHERGGRLTPAGILYRAESREQAIDLLQRHRYLT